MPPRRSKRRAKPATRAAAHAEPENLSSADDKENAAVVRKNVIATKAKAVPSSAVGGEGMFPDDVDEITPVYSTPKLAITSTANHSDKLTPLFDEEDEITPVQKVSAALLTSEAPTEYDIDEIDEISSLGQAAPLAPAPQRSENASSLPRLPNRAPLGILQSSEPAPFRPKKVTYGKRRRVHPVEMPTSHALGVTRYASPEKPENDSTGSPDGQGGDFEEDEDDDDDVQSPKEQSKGLQQFMKEQRVLWAEVDAVDLEEQLD